MIVYRYQSNDKHSFAHLIPPFDREEFQTSFFQDFNMSPPFFL